MKSTRSIFLAALMAVGFGGNILADGCCNNGSTCNSSCSSNCCDCCVTCCDDSDCDDCNTGCGSCSTGSSCNPCNDFCGGCATAKDVLLPFSQGENTARRYAGVAHLQNLPDQEDWNWHLDAALEYQQNFDRGLLGTYFFPNNTNQILVGQDRTLGGSADVRNVDLGLSPTFSGTLTICPRIQNVIFEPTLYVGLDRWVEGLWFDISLPVAYTKWSLKACEQDLSLGGSLFFPVPQITTGTLTNISTYTLAQNSMCPDPTGTNVVLGSTPTATWVGGVGDPTAVGATTICQAFSGNALWCAKGQGLGAGRILCNCDSNKTALADIPVQLGYNFINKDRGYLGAYIRAVFPTGKIENRRSIFDATVGYGRYQLGGGLQARVKLHERDDETAVSLFANVYATHIFSRHECRLFDIVGRGAWSRYLLMKEADVNGNFTGKLFSFADKFTSCVKSKFNWNVDGLLFLNLKHKGWTWDLGWEIKARACEQIDCSCISLCNPCAESDSRSCSEDDCDCVTTPNASIGSNQYGVKGPQIVGGVGTKVFDAADTTINTFGLQAIPNINVLNGAAIGTLTTPTAVLINANNFTSYLDLCRSVVPRAIANKVWSHLGYTWADRDYPIAAGLGFEVDFGQKNRQPRFWGIWGKITVAYN